MAERLGSIGIIGAGLGGVALAISLSSTFPRSKITIFESRSANMPANISSGVILTPNGLSVLDKLDILPLIQDKCYISTYRCFKDRNDVTTKKTPTALQERYGYSNHRLWRSVLLDSMLKVLAGKKNVSVLYEKRLMDILPPSQDQPGVRFTISSSGCSTVETLRVDLLVGADGINSTVRNLLQPSIQPEYTGTTGLLTHIPRSSVSWPSEDYERNATIQDVPGALFFLAEDAQAKVIMVGKQFRDLSGTALNDRAALDQLQNNKDLLGEWFCQRYDEYGDTARKILDSIKLRKDAIFLWPFMRMPQLPTWFRPDDGRVIILGDAAHAVPPSSGQGVNQVLEDVWMLTLLLEKYSTEGVPALHQGELLAVLAFWQSSRQTRIDQIYDWAMNVQNVARLSAEEREKVEAEQKQNQKQTQKQDIPSSDDMSWLYAPQIEDKVQSWHESRVEVKEL